MKIAAYTGTFNPLHIGHLAIMEYLTGHLDFSMVYLIVSPQSPFKKHMKAETGMERFKAAEEAVSRHPGLKVMVDDIELHLPRNTRSGRSTCSRHANLTTLSH